MESTIIQPGVSPSIYTTGERHHTQHQHHDDHRELRPDANFRALAAEVERFGVANGDRITGGTAVTGDRINAVGAAGALAAGHTDQLVQTAACHTDQLVLESSARGREITQAGFGDTSDRICASTKDITGSLGTGFTAAALAACKTSDEVAAVYAKLQKQVSDAATATVVGFKDAQATAYQIEGRTALDAAKNVATLGLQATTNANAASVEATKNFYATSLDQAKYANASTLQAQQIAAEAAAAAAACCCRLEMQAAENFAKLQALITAEGVSTRALANEIEARRVQNELVRLQTQVTVLTGGALGGLRAGA